ncbi:hypothetical protein PR001_g25606 [Phytophthora rubi]|uniref:Uncharacterized protein n=1 Tax=Phytophthora rubi TaxID=129364 RepID=A0A6A3HYR3_9STRA|nr:hypothetical protein PR001_g25606 [Phytophthora rubi]
MGGVCLHGVASATKIKSASWAYTSSAANVSYYVEMSPSPPCLDRAACVATSMGGVSLHGVASATNIESASWAYTSSASNASESLSAGSTNVESASWTSASTGTNSSYYVEVPPSPPRLDRAACVAKSMGEVSLHGVASATNTESASWTSASTGTNSSYYVQLSPSPPRVRRAACVAAVMGGVSLHAVASATNIESASWTSASTGTNSSYRYQLSPSPPVLPPSC